MIEAARAIGPSQPTAAALQSSPPRSVYADSWAAPAASMAATPPQATMASTTASAARGSEGSSIAASTARAQESALLAADVYRDTPAPPAGFRVADAADLARLNIQPEMLERAGSSFRARVYATGEGDGVRYVVAFRGSSSGEDWRNNFQQAAGANSESYAKALAIGERLGRSDASVTITGHSLGGGLASAAAVASGREADTFNAAGLTDRTIAAAKAISGGGDVAVQAYQVRGEILSFLQDGGDRLLGGIIFGVPGALLADAPSAYGSRHQLPDVAPEGKNWFERHSRIDRHMIDWVVAGAAAMR